MKVRREIFFLTRDCRNAQKEFSKCPGIEKPTERTVYRKQLMPILRSAERQLDERLRTTEKALIAKGVLYKDVDDIPHIAKDFIASLDTRFSKSIEFLVDVIRMRHMQRYLLHTRDYRWRYTMEKLQKAVDAHIALGIDNDLKTAFDL